MDGAVIVDAEEEGEREAPSLSFFQLRFVVFSRFCRFVISFRRFVYFIPPFCRFVVYRVRLNSILSHRYECAVLSFCLFSCFVVFVLTIKLLVNFSNLQVTWRAFCHFVSSFLSFFLLVGQTHLL